MNKKREIVRQNIKRWSENNSGLNALRDTVEQLNADAERWFSGDMDRDNEDAGMLSHEAAVEILRLRSKLAMAVDLLEKWAASPYKGPTLETKNFLRGKEKMNNM